MDNQCTGCGICESDAQENFKLNDEGLAFVYKQPEGEFEIKQRHSALESCPAEAIGNDG